MQSAHRWDKGDFFASTAPLPNDLSQAAFCSYPFHAPVYGLGRNKPTFGFGLIRLNIATDLFRIGVR